MKSTQYSVMHWNRATPPTESDLIARLREAGLHGHKWANGPGERYSPHSHTYAKTIYVVSGRVTFGLPHTGEQVVLEEGDRLELPAGVVHDATVGPQGVVCLEAHS